MISVKPVNKIYYSPLSFYLRFGARSQRRIVMVSTTQITGNHNNAVCWNICSSQPMIGAQWTPPEAANHDIRPGTLV